MKNSFLVWHRAAQSMMDFPIATLLTPELQFAGFRTLRSEDKIREQISPDDMFTVRSYRVVNDDVKLGENLINIF